MKIKDILKFAVLTTLPVAFTGCTGTNPKPPQNEVRQTVASRLGELAPWPDSDSTNDVVQTVAALLRTNLTAQSATAIALLNNRSLQAEFQEIGISQADLAQASRLPNIEFAGSWRFPNRPPSTADVEYSAAGNLLDLLTLPVRKKVAAQNLEQTKLQVADKVLQLAADTQTAFYDLQAQLELVIRLNTILQVNEASADFAQRQYDAGDINDLELQNQQASVAQSHLDLMEAKAKAQAEREHLNRLLGLSDEQINWQITDELPLLPASELPLENLESIAVDRRLDLAALHNQAESIAVVLRLKKHTRFVPGATLGVDTEQTPDGQRVTGPTLDLELPIFDQGQPAVAKLAAEFQQAKDNYAALEVNVRSEVRQAQNGLLAAREAAEFSENNLLPLRQAILDETLLQYNAMQKNSFDLLLAKEREQNAEESCITSLRDYWIARVGLERAVGGRLAGETSSPPPVMDPQKMPNDHQR